MPDARRMASPRHEDCDRGGSPGRALLSSVGAVSYLRCSCGVWPVLQEGEPLALVAPENNRAPTAILSVNDRNRGVNIVVALLSSQSSANRLIGFRQGEFK
jgi:hypothetical protein